ncbi:MAG TPA: helix-turn-helix transcriptional regulator [Candidatus Cryosericum sp.]|nr:helix-turn-helix transcriptional regulator [Candidatus Cryosericum sp.]
MTNADILKALREAAGLSLQDVCAGGAGVSPNHLGRLERGARGLSPLVFGRVLQAIVKQREKRINREAKDDVLWQKAQSAKRINIKRLRLAAHATQEEIAAASGVSQPTICAIETGKVKGTPALQSAIIAGIHACRQAKVEQRAARDLRWNEVLKQAGYATDANGKGATNAATR